MLVIVIDNPLGTCGLRLYRLSVPRPYSSRSTVWANATSDGITRDLEAMAESGIGGTYLMPIGNAGKRTLALSAEGWVQFEFARPGHGTTTRDGSIPRNPSTRPALWVS